MVGPQHLISENPLVAAMHGQGVGAIELNEVVAILYSLKGEVLRT